MFRYNPFHKCSMGLRQKALGRSRWHCEVLIMFHKLFLYNYCSNSSWKMPVSLQDFCPWRGLPGLRSCWNWWYTTKYLPDKWQEPVFPSRTLLKPLTIVVFAEFIFMLFLPQNNIALLSKHQMIYFIDTRSNSCVHWRNYH